MKKSGSYFFLMKRTFKIPKLEHLAAVMGLWDKYCSRFERPRNPVRRVVATSMQTRVGRVILARAPFCICYIAYYRCLKLFNGIVVPGDVAIV